MYSLITATAVLAIFAAAVPYPPEATTIPPTLPHAAFYGNKHGNFMNSTTPSPTTKIPTPAAKGGVVSGGAAVTSINNQDGIGAGSDYYNFYSGDGSQQAGWPTKAQWVSFENMFNNNKGIMFESCGDNGWGDNDSGPEVGAIYDGIQQVAAETNVDHRFILATIIQESGGCVRVSYLSRQYQTLGGNLTRNQVPTTNYGVRNPGLMQCHNGDGTCNSDYTGQVQSPCPSGVVWLFFEFISKASNLSFPGHTDDSRRHSWYK
jgi:hypothetical protein